MKALEDYTVDELLLEVRSRVEFMVVATASREDGGDLCGRYRWFGGEIPCLGLLTNFKARVLRRMSGGPADEWRPED